MNSVYWSKSKQISVLTWRYLYQYSLFTLFLLCVRTQGIHFMSCENLIFSLQHPLRFIKIPTFQGCGESKIKHYLREQHSHKAKHRSETGKRATLLASLCLSTSQSEQSLRESLCAAERSSKSFSTVQAWPQRLPPYKDRGMVKEERQREDKKMLFFSALVILPSDETLFNLNLPPRGYTSNGVIFFFPKVFFWIQSI